MAPLNLPVPFTFFAIRVVLLLFLYCEYNFAPSYIHLHLFYNKSALYMLQDITELPLIMLQF